MSPLVWACVPPVAVMSPKVKVIGAELEPVPLPGVTVAVLVAVPPAPPLPPKP